MHGIPFSVKDHIDLEGTRTTLGVLSLRDNIAESTAEVVLLCLKSGAIPTCKGNLAEMDGSYHTSNEVWGEAQNPNYPSRACGGSSGGDAALVATKTVLFGIGSDLGGSLRVPAVSNGLATFKATKGIIPTKGVRDYCL